jgi:hypothetical protein
LGKRQYHQLCSFLLDWSNGTTSSLLFVAPTAEALRLLFLVTYLEIAVDGLTL